MGGMRTLCREEKRELKVLADDFGLLDREEVQEIIATCSNYKEGQQAILRVFERVYMS